MHSAALATIYGDVLAGKLGYVDDILIARNGSIVLEKSYPHDYARLCHDRIGRGGQYDYYDPNWHPYFAHSDLHTLQSITKSITSALIGIAIGRGEIPSVDATLLSYLRDLSSPDTDSRRAAITLGHVLTMTTGIRWNESGEYTDPRNLCAQMEQSDDWIQFVWNQSMEEEPGKRFLYNSGAAQLLSYVIQKSTGMPADEYAHAYLFEPLGIRDYYWKRTPKGLADTEGGLYLTTRDLAKIGLLYLQDGSWNGRRVLPEGWVAESTAPIVSTASDGFPDRRYGYLWWLLPTPKSYALAALGYGEQRLFIVPEEDLVAVLTGWNIDASCLSAQAALDRILAATK